MTMTPDATDARILRYCAMFVLLMGLILALGGILVQHLGAIITGVGMLLTACVFDAISKRIKREKP